MPQVWRVESDSQPLRTSGSSCLCLRPSSCALLSSAAYCCIKQSFKVFSFTHNTWRHLQRSRIISNSCGYLANMLIEKIIYSWEPQKMDLKYKAITHVVGCWSMRCKWDISPAKRSAKHELSCCSVPPPPQCLRPSQVEVTGPLRRQWSSASLWFWIVRLGDTLRPPSPGWRMEFLCTMVKASACSSRGRN